jgi:hypothetical protein
LDALLHLQSKHGEPNHKLELLDIGKKSYSEIIHLIESVTDADPMKLGIMRIDLTADVPNVTVPWFREHLRFKSKQKGTEYGKLAYQVIGRGEVETILAGSRPNVFRVYNKTQEQMVQFRRMLRRANKDADPLDFEREFGVKETDVQTRVERQCGGSRIPLQLAKLRDLHRTPDFNPFVPLEIVSSGRFDLPPPQDCEGLEYYTGLGMYAEAKRVGMQEFRKQLNKQTKGNAARTLERYARFFPDGERMPITVHEIYEMYRQSVTAQLAA